MKAFTLLASVVALAQAQDESSETGLLLEFG